MEDDGFKLVKSSRKNNRFCNGKKFLKRNVYYDLQYLKGIVDIGPFKIHTKEELFEQIDKCLIELQQYLKAFEYGLADILSKKSNNQNDYEERDVNKNYQNQSFIQKFRFKEIVCFGLGNFTQSSSSLYQFALLYHLIKQSTLNETKSTPFRIYDPVFTEPEKNILRSIGFDALKEDLECRYRIKTDQNSASTLPTLFYMPHMYYDHYYNLLHCNQDNLDKIIIFGNHLAIYLEVFQQDKSNKLGDFLKFNQDRFKLIQHPINSKLFRFIDVFSQQSFHSFLKL